MIIQTETPSCRKEKEEKNERESRRIRFIGKNSVRFSTGAPQLQKSMGSNPSPPFGDGRQKRQN